ncbi:recombinase family protein [Sphaerisporangium sp. NPDC049002]|uniref:recombinase family protein n=1 Tax=Sphaerisporangium sp. NPDC049002 TaxID=3155392 RepID=UPI0033DA0747
MDITPKATSGKRLRYGGNVRISEDPEVLDEKTGQIRRLERGITRQKEDVAALAERLGGEISVWYEENDTSAFKKRRIRLPDGRSVWRVIRPEFRRMLADYEDGKIDGIIFYDLDRLTRQNRDLEDLIDLVEFFKRPVESVTGQLDLRTSGGRTMARVLVAMANKSSEDTARRVARARLQQAQDGQGRKFGGYRRPFGYDREGDLIEAEAELLRAALRRFLAGESWTQLVNFFQASGISPVVSRTWSITSVKQNLLSPSNAGLSVYNGTLRKENQEGQRRSRFADIEGTVLKDAAGEYVIGPWEPIISVAQWEQAIAEQNRRLEGQTFTGKGTRKHLLSGLLRCGLIREDGSVCNRTLIGTVRKYNSGKTAVAYRCPAKVLGGCGCVQRNGAKMDALAEDLLFAHITANAPAITQPDSDGQAEQDPEAEALADVRRRLATMRQQYATGAVSDETFFSTVPTLEAREKKLKAAVKKKEQARSGDALLRRSPEQIRREWEQASTSGKRAILGQYLQAIIVGPSTTRGPVFDYSTVRPVWKSFG